MEDNKERISIKEQELIDMRQALRMYASQVALYQGAVAHKIGLTTSDMRCFRVISTYGPMTAGELSRHTGFTTGGITKILDHLEKHGAIRRRVQTTDRRITMIEAVDLERTTIGKVDVDFDRMITTMMHEYSSREAELIRDFIERSSTMLIEMTGQLQVDSDIE